MMTTTIDTTQALKQLYRARQMPELVDVPELSFLMIDGHGDPNVSAEFQAAIQALFGVSYTLKFAIKRAGGPTTRSPRSRDCGWSRTCLASASRRSRAGTGR